MAHDIPSFKIMEEFPHKLERADLLVYLYRIDETAFGSALNWHSMTLRRLILVGRSSSIAICLILAECKGLEWVEVSGSDVDLAEVISISWACTRVRHLELTVRIPDLISSITSQVYRLRTEAREIPYHCRQPPITFTDREQKRLRMLGAFYRQIGQLEQMEHLDLRAATEFENVHYSLYNRYRYATFLGMLSLGDEKVGGVEDERALCRVRLIGSQHLIVRMLLESRSQA